MYKSNVGDFPLLDHPCKYWWVRYAVACNYLTESFQKIWQKKLDETKEKYKVSHFCYQGIFNITKVGGGTKKQIQKRMKMFLNSKIIVTFQDKTEREIKPDIDEELYNILRQYIQQTENIQLIDCPYENNHQSKCPFYKPNEFYKDISLEELRKRKGYNI